MTARRRLWRGGGLVVLGNAAGAALGLGLLLVLARTFPPEGLAVVIAVVGLIDGGQMLLDATINTSMINLAARGGTAGRPEARYLRAGLLLKTGLGLVYALALVAASGPLSIALVGDRSLASLVALSGAAAAVAGLYGFVLAVLTAHEAFGRLAAVSLGKNLLRIGAVGAVLATAGPDPRLAALAIAATTLPCLLLSTLALRRGCLSGPGALLPAARRLTGLSGWMLLAALAMLGGRFDLWVVGWLSSAAEAGRYALAAQLCVGVGIVTQALVTTLLPSVSRLRSTAEVSGFLRRSAVAALPLMILPLLAWPLAGPVLGLVFGAEYAGAAGIFVVLFLASVMTLIGAPLMLTLLSLGEARVLALGALAQVALRLLLALALVPMLGGIGMAAGDVASRLIAMALIAGIVLAVLRRGAGAPPGAAPLTGRAVDA